MADEVVGLHAEPSVIRPLGTDSSMLLAWQNSTAAVIMAFPVSYCLRCESQIFMIPAFFISFTPFCIIDFVKRPTMTALH